MDAFGLAIILLAIYFIPLFVAVMREHKNAVPIAVLNTLLGWTFFGWVFALVWSFTSQENK